MNKSHYSPEQTPHMPPSVGTRLYKTEQAERFINTITQHLVDQPAVQEASAQVAVNQAVEFKPEPQVAPAVEASHQPSDVSQEQRVMLAQKLTENAYTQAEIMEELKGRGDHGIAA